MKKVENKFCLNFSYKLDEDCKDVAVMVAGYIAKNLVDVLSAPNANLKLLKLKAR